MASETNTAVVPSEFISDKTFKTLGQASGGVYLISIVISLLTSGSLGPAAYRNIGFVLSVLAACFILLKKNNRKSFKNWVFIFLNGVLIFVNVSGMNSITADFQKVKSEEKPKAENQIMNTDLYTEAGLIPIPYVIDWWPNEQLLEENRELRRQIQVLDSINQKLRLESKGVMNEQDKIAMDSIKKSNDSLQSLLANSEKLSGKSQASLVKQIDSLKQQIKRGDKVKYDSGKIDDASAKQIENLKTDISRLENRVNELKEQKGIFEKQIKKLENDMKLCEERKSELQKKLNGMNNNSENPDKSAKDLKECQQRIKDLNTKLQRLEIQLSECKNAKDSSKKTIKIK